MRKFHQRRRALRNGTATKRERGAVMIEATIILPLLLLMVFGIAELGFLFKDTITLTTTTRAGARVASNLADNRNADYETLRTITAAAGGKAIGLENIEAVLIYNATNHDGVPPACLDANGDPQASNATDSECNLYTNAQVTLVANDPAEAVKHFGGTNTPATDLTCSTVVDSKPIWDVNFCPSQRNRTPNPRTEYIGVYVQVNHDYITGVLLMDSISFSDSTVMGIEPLGAL